MSNASDVSQEVNCYKDKMVTTTQGTVWNLSEKPPESRCKWFRTLKLFPDGFVICF